MPDRLYTNTAQLAPITSAPDAGTDIVPGNVLKLAFVEIAGAIGGATPFTAVNILLLATWTPRLAAMDNTKIVLTPYIDNFKNEPGKAITEGGYDASTYNGVPRLRSIGYSTISGKLSGVSSALIANLRKLASKAGNFQHGTRLGVYFFHEGKGISANAAGQPVPVYNVFFGDPMLVGLGASDDYEFEAHLEGGWSNARTIYETTDFTPSALVNP